MPPRLLMIRTGSSSLLNLTKERSGSSSRKRSSSISLIRFSADGLFSMCLAPGSLWIPIPISTADWLKAPRSLGSVERPGTWQWSSEEPTVTKFLTMVRPRCAIFCTSSPFSEAAPRTLAVNAAPVRPRRPTRPPLLRPTDTSSPTITISMSRPLPSLWKAERAFSEAKPKLRQSPV